VFDGRALVSRDGVGVIATNKGFCGELRRDNPGSEVVALNDDRGVGLGAIGAEEPHRLAEKAESCLGEVHLGGNPERRRGRALKADADVSALGADAEADGLARILGWSGEEGFHGVYLGDISEGRDAGGGNLCDEARGV
jgi:hypothetical protein